MPWKGRNIYKLPIFGFHVSFQGCNPLKKQQIFPEFDSHSPHRQASSRLEKPNRRNPPHARSRWPNPKSSARAGWELGRLDGFSGMVGWMVVGWMEKCQNFLLMNWPTRLFWGNNKKSNCCLKGKRQQCKKRNINQDTSTKKRHNASWLGMFFPGIWGEKIMKIKASAKIGIVYINHHKKDLECT